MQCESPILGIMMRTIKLNACGVPVTGASSQVVTMAGFIQVQIAPQYDTGDRKILRTAAGVICSNKKIPDRYTNDQLTIDICSWNPGLFLQTVALQLFTASGSATGIGTGNGYGETDDDNHTSLEVWQEVSGEGACDPDTGQQVYLYHAWPNLSDWKRGQNTINMDPTQAQLIANTNKGSALWTAGATWLDSNTPQSGLHYLHNFTTAAPPTEACSITAYPS